MIEVESEREIKCEDCKAVETGVRIKYLYEELRLCLDCAGKLVLKLLKHV